jgi:hypothetical protein
MFFDDSVVRFTDFGTILCCVPSDKSLAYCHAVRFTDLLLFLPIYALRVCSI